MDNNKNNDNQAEYVVVGRMFKINETIERVSLFTGLLGSVLMFAVYSRASFSKLSVSIYFKIIAIVCFLSSTSQLFLNYFHYSFNDVYTFPVNLFLFLIALRPPLSAWLEVLASIDRLFTITFPFSHKFIQKPLIQLILIAIVIVSSSLFYSYMILGQGFFSFISGIPDNKQNDVKMSNFIHKIDVVFCSALPFALMLVTSIVTFVGVLRSYRRIRSSLGSRNAAQRKLLKDIKFGVTLIVLNVMFFICVGFYRLSHFINFNPFNRKKQTSLHFAFHFVLTNLHQDYHVLNFFLQLTINSVVRRELVNIFIDIYKKIRSLFRNIFSI